MDAVRLILDTDIGCDCDDAGAMGVMHALAKRGEVEILAVTHCYEGSSAAGCIDAINSWCGRPDLPVGSFPAVDGAHWNDQYASEIARIFPNRFQNGEEPDHTVRVLRRALINSGGGVTLAVIGSLRSLEGLMKSTADDICQMNGNDLIQAMVGRCVIMGGRFHETWPDPQHVDGGIVDAEFNIVSDIPAAQFVVDNWPGELVFCSYEIGLGLITGACLTGEANPIRRAYEIFGAKGGRDSWDLATVLYAARPDQGYFDLHDYGRVSVDERGITSWSDDGSARHTYLLPKAGRERLREVLDGLLIEVMADATCRDKPCT